MKLVVAFLAVALPLLTSEATSGKGSEGSKVHGLLAKDSAGSQVHKIAADKPQDRVHSSQLCYIGNGQRPQDRVHSSQLCYISNGQRTDGMCREIKVAGGRQDNDGRIHKAVAIMGDHSMVHTILAELGHSSQGTFPPPHDEVGGEKNLI